MMRNSLISLLSMLLLGALPSEAERLALVIGNSSYERSQPLAQTSTDAVAMAEKLRSLGFRIIGGHAHIDLNRAEMLRQIRSLGAAASDGDEVVFYFSGHGIGGTQTNFLLPVDDTYIETREDVPDLAIDVASILKRLPRSPDSVNIFILDACRNNPLPSRAKSAFAEKGLTRILSGASNTVFLYAAEPGERAYTSLNGGSYFTNALLDALDTPGSSLTDLMREVRSNVSIQTRGEAVPQVPWFEGLTAKPFFFHDSPAQVSEPFEETTDASFSSQVTPALLESASSQSETILSIPSWDQIPNDRWRNTDPHVLLEEVLETQSMDDLLSAAETGNLNALFLSGQLKLLGEDVEADYDYSFSAFETACELNHLAACSSLGYSFAIGAGTERDWDRARTIYSDSCEKGQITACSRLGFYYSGQHVSYQDAKTDHHLANSYLEPSCSAGDLFACLALGVQRLEGNGGRTDYNAARRLFTSVCDADLLGGCHHLGLLYDAGSGVTQNYEKAGSYFKRDCDKKHAAACLSLGAYYEYGYGVPQNYLRASQLYTIACDHGRADACNALGVLHSYGRGVAADNGIAVFYFKRSCEGGWQMGCANLGVYEINGLGVKKNRRSGLKRLSAACEQNTQWACAKFQELK